MALISVEMLNVGWIQGVFLTEGAIERLQSFLIGVMSLETN